MKNEGDFKKEQEQNDENNISTDMFSKFEIKKNKNTNKDIIQSKNDFVEFKNKMFIQIVVFYSSTYKCKSIDNDCFKYGIRNTKVYNICIPTISSFSKVLLSFNPEEYFCMHIKLILKDFLNKFNYEEFNDIRMKMEKEFDLKIENFKKMYKNYFSNEFLDSYKNYNEILIFFLGFYKSNLSLKEMNYSDFNNYTRMVLFREPNENIILFFMPQINHIIVNSNETKTNQFLNTSTNHSKFYLGPKIKNSINSIENVVIIQDLFSILLLFNIRKDYNEKNSEYLKNFIDTAKLNKNYLNLKNHFLEIMSNDFSDFINFIVDENRQSSFIYKNFLISGNTFSNHVLKSMIYDNYYCKFNITFDEFKVN